MLLGGQAGWGWELTSGLSRVMTDGVTDGRAHRSAARGAKATAEFLVDVLKH